MGGREGDVSTGEREGMGGHTHSHTRQEHSPTYNQQEMQDKQKKGEESYLIFLIPFFFILTKYHFFRYFNRALNQ